MQEYISGRYKAYNAIIDNRDGVGDMCTMKKEHEIYFAGGCFWGVEKYFSCVEGVLRTTVGYANGKGEHPSYEDVCEGSRGFCECVQVVFDSSTISLAFLLQLFYRIIDPTSINKQGNDCGIQYRTGIYYTKKMDALIIDESLQELQKIYVNPIVVEVLPLKNFYIAEDYHQKYLMTHPQGYCHISAQHFMHASKASCSLNNLPEERFRKKNQNELKLLLSREQYEVTQHNATEEPYHNEYWNTFDEGIYIDVTTGEPLFLSTDKFASKCGWPCFTKPITEQCVVECNDISQGLQRIEVRSAIGDAHLGHVFSDGPQETGGMRYCINSAALRFIPKNCMREYGYGDYLYLFPS